ncbi:MAG: hypothetical protein ACOX9A_06145 [Anaerolineae bacterium]|jgi:hypothetical protein
MIIVHLTWMGPEDQSPPVRFGVNELADAIRGRGMEVVETMADDGNAAGTASVTIGLLLTSSAPKTGASPRFYAEDYVIIPCAEGPMLVGHGPAGMMYACLDLAEQLAMGADLRQVTPRSATPELAVRGLYAFLHNAEAERDWLYDPAFWQDYADTLARYRFNRFNLIYGHQTAHLIPIYAHLLDDLDDDFPGIRVEGITSEERARNLAALQAASAAMASRDITFCLGIWQSRPWTVANGVWETQPTRVTGIDDLALLADYTRRGFLTLIERCPHIDAVQLRMNIESGVGDQRFFVQAFAPALQELAARGRRLTVELRNWGLHPDTVEAFRRSGAEVVVSTKYFAEHQAMPYQPPVMRGSYSYDSYLRVDKPFAFQWHLWNLGSHRLFAWGDPDWARRFVQSCHLGDGVGFEATPPGSQKGFGQWGQVTPGDWAMRSDLPPRPDFEHYWFFLMALGRMAYDPTTPDEVFVHQLALRATPEAAPHLLAAYRAAGKVVSYLISQRMDDPNMYVWPELDAGGPIDHHIDAPPGEVTLFATAREYARCRVQGQGSAKRSPFDAADDLERLADEIDAHLKTLADMPGLEESVEYRVVRVDFAALSALARYHAAKSRAAGHLALFYAVGERHNLDDAEDAAAQAVDLWEALCERTAPFYDRLHLGPSGGHWRHNLPRVRYDLTRVRRVRQLWEAHGLFVCGLDAGPGTATRAPERERSGLEIEPRFDPLGPDTAYTPDRGYGWLNPAGLQAAGAAPLPRELAWGVHYIRPGETYDPAIVDAIPTDGLTHGYITAETPHTLRIDLPDGLYRVTLIAPLVSGFSSSARIGAETVTWGQSAPSAVSLDIKVRGGCLQIALGEDGPWALAGLVVRAMAPQIAHLPPRALCQGDAVMLTTTATAPSGPCSMTLRYLWWGEWRETAMSGDGESFVAMLPADCPNSLLEYEFVARAPDARESRSVRYRVPMLKGYRPPEVVDASGPERWSPSDTLTFCLTLVGGEYAREVRLHYREADQNRPFRVASLPGGRSGDYVHEIDACHLDRAYELLYYWEVLDALGGGTFYPDPFSDVRYRIARPDGE